MPQKIKSRPKPILNAPKGISKPTGVKKTIVCHCWPGVYEAAVKLKDTLRDRGYIKNASISMLINCLISIVFEDNFGFMPSSNEHFQKGEN